MGSARLAGVVMDAIPYTPPAADDVARIREAIEAHKAQMNLRDGAKRQ